MNTFFAPAERATNALLSAEIDIVEKSPVLEGLLHTADGLLAIVNEERQIVALNNSLLIHLGIDDPDAVLGLRPGQALACIHAGEEPNGCGTTRFCSTCGAAIAMVTSLHDSSPCEKTCVLSATKNGVPVDVALRVKSHPVLIDGYRFLLLFLQDISRHEEQAALERVFFHDINNSLQALIGTCDQLVYEAPSVLSRRIQEAALHLIGEVAIQRQLSSQDRAVYRVVNEEIYIDAFLDDLRTYLLQHHSARDKEIAVVPTQDDETVTTDRSLLMRIIHNMSINALEATQPGGEIMLRAEVSPDSIDFIVWNEGELPKDISLRIFQRYFSTKKGPGRGVGTYSMKLFGEKYLGGKLTFETSAETGTTFRLSLPKLPD